MLWTQLKALDNQAYLRYIERIERRTFWGYVLGITLAIGFIGTALSF
jgi:hypothetical protein